MLRFAFPWRAPEPGAEIETKCIEMVASPQTTEELAKDLAAGARIVREQLAYPATTTREIAIFGRSICAIMVFSVENRGQDDPVFTTELYEALWDMILDPQRYDMFDIDSKDLTIDPYPVVSPLIHVIRTRELNRCFRSRCTVLCRCFSRACTHSATA